MFSAKAGTLSLKDCKDWDSSKLVMPQTLFGAEVLTDNASNFHLISALANFSRSSLIFKKLRGNATSLMKNRN